MRKIFLVIFMLTHLLVGKSPQSTPAKKISVNVDVGMRLFSETVLKDVYGSSTLDYSLDLAYRFSDQIALVITGSYLNMEGSIVPTQESTTLSIIEGGGGLRYYLGESNLKLYLGAGAGYSMVKEENVLGTFDENKVCIYGEGGVNYFFSPSTFIDLKIKYRSLSAEGDLGNMNLGGLNAMAGLGFLL